MITGTCRAHAGLVAVLLTIAACGSSRGTRPPPARDQIVQLQWAPIVDTEDGQPLTDIDHYRLSYTGPGGAVQQMIYAAGQTAATLRLPTGCYRLQLIAHSASLGDSAPSNQVQTGACSSADTASGNPTSLCAPAYRPCLRLFATVAR